MKKSGIKWIDLSRVLLIVLLFIYIFNPRCVKVDIRKLIDLAAYVFLIVNLLKNHGKIEISHIVLRILFPFIVFIVYAFFNMCLKTAINGRSGMDVYVKEFLNTAIYLIRTLLIVIAAKGYCDKFKISLEEFIKEIVACGIIQLFFVLLAFFVPSVRSLFNSWIISNSDAANIVLYAKYVTNHGYGLCENVYDSFGYIVSLIMILEFINGIHYNSNKSIIMSIVMLIMLFLNARTGIVLFAVGAMLTIIYYKKSILLKHGVKYILMLIIMIMIVVYGIKVLPGSTLEWLQKGVDDIFMLLFEGTQQGFFSAILSGVSFPSDIFFGAGASPGNMGAMHTDIGYIQCIWRYGIIGTIIFLSGYIQIFWIAIKKQNNYNNIQCFTICTMAIFFIYLFKIYGLGNMGANVILFSIIGISILENDQISRKEIL